MTMARRSLRDRRGAAALEFGIVAGVFIPLCLAGLDAGLLLWTKTGLEYAAAATARCKAIASPSCADAQQFAVAQAGAWVFAGVIGKADVTSSSVCIANASFAKVTITCAYWAGTALPPPLSRRTMTVAGYFPVAGASC